jgi:hypothetical protein
LAIFKHYAEPDMKSSYPLLLLLSVLIMAGCNSHSAKKKKVDSIKNAPHQLTAADSERAEDYAVAQIEKLTEYQHLTRWFDTANKDSSLHIAILTEATPTKNTDYYQFELGVDGPERFQDMELFYVDAKTLTVQHVDKETGYPTTITQWRKSGKDDWLK